MNSDYFKNFLNLKEQSKATYQSCLERISKSFEELKRDHNNNACFKFEYELQTLKDFRELKAKDKQNYYKYFVERNHQNFAFMRDNRSVELRLVKATKTHLEDYQLKWREIWQNVIENEPEIPAVKLYSELIDFLKNIRHLYDPNNAIEVIDYFLSHHSLYTNNIYLYISLFANLTQKTSPQVLIGYIRRLLEMYELNQLKASNFLVMFINAAKFRTADIPLSIYHELNNIILYSLVTPASEKKDSIEAKFNTQTANIVLKIMGLCNPHSLKLIQQIFQVIKNFIRPFEDTKKPFKFFYHLVSGLAKRLEAEDAWRKKIVRLREKEEKRKRKEEKQKEKLKEKEKEEKALEDNEESAVTNPDAKLQKVEEPVKEDEVEQQESEEEDEKQNESDEEEQDGSIEKMVTMQIDVEENTSEKLNTTQSKIDKLEAFLKNSITEEIKQCFKSFIDEKFEDIFYVNSKKIVPKILKEIFKIYPEFITKSFDVLEKAGSIPQINEQGLISNITHIAKYLFSKPAIEEGNLLENMLRLLNRVQQNRRITDVWDIINIFSQKIPLLDEKDMEKISDQDKELFEKKYAQHHDRFYQTYSELVFESLKRLFDESEHFDTSTAASIDKSVIDILGNCYPYFKKRVLKEMEERIAQSSNKFLLLVFHSSLKPSKSMLATLKQLTDNRNIESEQNLELDINVNIILSAEMEITEIKKLIRKYSRKNNYKFLKNTMINLTNYNLQLEPLTTTLDYLHTKPNFKITQQPPYSFIKEKLKHVYDYSLQILDQLSEELKEFSDRPLKVEDYHALIGKMYDSNDKNFKNLKVQKRKTVNELLEILKTIQENLFHEMEEYNPEANSISYTEPPYKRESLLHNEKFTEVLDNLIYNEIFLHDHNIMQNLSLLLENEIFFMYRHQVRLEKDILKKYSKKNQREELPGESNLVYMTNLFITKARIAHFSLLFSKYKDTIDVTPFEHQLKILLVAPGNQKCNLINKILVKKTKDIRQQAQHLIDLLSNPVQSRFYTEKILNLIAEFNTIGFSYSTQQVVSLIDLHIPLIQSENIKIRENALKSFEKFTKTLSKSSLIGPGEHELRKYLEKEKLQIVWIISVISILREPKRNTDTETYLQNIQEYLRELAKLIQSETRIIRRIALFTYSFCLRKAKQAIKSIEQVKSSNQKYDRPKTIAQIYETGYLRDEHLEHKSISNRGMVKKMAPYSSCLIKKKAQLQIFSQIEEQAFQFILRDEETGVKILKQFHIDMAGSVEQVLSMMHNKKHDLGEITLRMLEGCYVYTKMKKLHFDRIESYFGERFYRYLFDKDAKNGFKFFLHSRHIIEELLSNFQAFDNQTLIFTFTMDVFFAYEKHYQTLGEDVRVELQKFILKIIAEVIYKGSAVLFKKLSIIMSKNVDKKFISFVIAYLEGLLKNGEKVSRATQLIFIILQENYDKLFAVVSSVLEQQQEINHNFVHLLINSIITLPEKYLLTKSSIDRYGFIDAEAQIARGALQIYKPHIFMLSTKKFNDFLQKKLKDYIQQAGKEGDGSEQMTKTRNELIKSSYSIATSSISAYVQFYETEETIESVAGLLDTLFSIFDFKMDLQVDFKQLEDALKHLFSSKYEQIEHFHRLLKSILHGLTRLPAKKQADLLKLITSRPGNFFFIDRNIYRDFLLTALRLEDNSMIYRDVLVSLSTILAYVPLSTEEISSLANPLPKPQALLLLQAHLLATLDIGSNLVERVLRECGRDRRNIFCKEILLARGKKEYLDDEQHHLQWKEIKQHSNPYHYHA